MRPWLVLLIGALALSAASWGLPAAVAAAQTSPDASVTVTSDSAPGWLPSAEQVSQARATALDYLAAEDAGRTSQAYGMMAEPSRALLPLADYSAGVDSFHRQAGAVRSRRIVLISWTKDPAQAPARGVYAALDLESAFAKVARHCGYLVLYQAPEGGAFTVVREESNYISDAEYDRIAGTKSKIEAEQLWAKVSANCPNYRAAEAHAAAAPLVEQPDTFTDYPTVAAALAGLKAKPGVKISDVHGWTVITDEATRSIWSFSPPGDPAYPAVIKRRVIDKEGRVFLDMTAQCEASKEACDKLVRQFQQMNDALATRAQAGDKPH